ncbi:MAG: hypothetical protein LC122_13200 [Chitinophagales bacterium]|nr:hypothetical protein [Chitinophagales bacterium]
MRKLSHSLYNRLYLQAEEAKLAGNKKLANFVFKSLGSFPSETGINESNLPELKEALKSSLLNACIDYADLNDKEDIDIVKLEEFCEEFSIKFLNSAKKFLKVE